jgi:sulfate adenylyltransferase subunit 1
MDLVGFSESVFQNIRDELVALVKKLNIDDPHFIPISAKLGDNVVDESLNMSWYTGKTFLNLIETIEILKDKNSHEARFPVQTTIRPLSSEFHDYRGYAGRVAGGIFHTGDEVTVLPSMLRSRIARINVMDKSLPAAANGDSVSFILEDQIDTGRGNLIVRNNELPECGKDIELMTCWFNEKPLRTGGRYRVRNYSNETQCIVKSVNYRMNINTLGKDISNREVRMNDIASISIKTAKPLFYDSYRKNNITGSVIFIEEGTNETVAAGMID